MAVLLAFVLFITLNANNVNTFLERPKSVNVEVNQESPMAFPAVTICNYNKHR